MSRSIVALGLVGLLISASPAFAKDIPPEIQSLLDQENYRDVVAPLSEFLEKEKKNHEAWSSLGTAYYNLERYEDARDAFEKALKIKKKYWPAVHGMNHVLLQLAEFDEAEKRIRDAIKDAKKEESIQAMFFHDLGLLQLTLGTRDTLNVDNTLLDSAENNLYVASGMAPDSSEFRLDLAEMNFARKRYQMAISAYEDVLAGNPDMAGAVYYRIARAQLYQRKFKAAVEAYQKSAEAKPTARVYSDLGDALILYQRSLPPEDTTLIFDTFDQAIAAYTKAKDYTADGCRIYEKLGKAEALMRRLEAAVEDFEAAIECGSEDPNVFFALGNVLIDLQRFDDALQWYERYKGMREAKLEEKPWDTPDADFFANYGLVYRMKADSTEAGPGQDELYNLAIQNYTRAVDLDPARAGILSDLGIVLFNMKRYRDAIPVFQRKIEMEPDLTNGYLNLAYCYLQLKKYDSVLTALDGMLAVDSCNAQAFEIGGYVAAFELNNGSLARKWYNRQLACQPANCNAKMYIGYTYLVTNDTTQIRRCIPVLQDAYECRLAAGEAKCGDNMKQNALWLAEAHIALRNLDQAVSWARKVLACEPGHKRAKQIKEQAESEY